MQAADDPAIRLTITVETQWGAKEASVPTDTTVGEFIDAVVRGCGADPDANRYALEVPVGPLDEEPQYEEVADSEILLDALRAVFRRPQIVPKARKDQ